jgi:hypothetical protein
MWNSLFACSNSADSLFSANSLAVLVNALACSGRQGICAQRPGIAARIDVEPPNDPKPADYAVIFAVFWHVKAPH